MIARALILSAALAAAAPAPAAEETLVAARAIRARTVLGPGDLATVPGATPGALSHPDEAIGLETRAMIARGRPIAAGDLGPAAFVDRNQIVTMLFERGGLSIRAEGRALDRAAEGERVRVMNLDSRNTVTGVAVAPGVVAVR